MDEQLILEVNQVSTYIKEMMDSDALLVGLCVRGEISNYKKYPSGHHYFTLKDETSALKCVMFRSAAIHLQFQPENGMKVLAAGHITVYPRDGIYQLYCISMMPDGAGNLALAFEQLKQKLSNEGLFDESHKKPIPQYPHEIALITSPAGAALQDMLRILSQRYPLTEAKLLPVQVQGSQASGEIAAAIDYANQHHIADLIIIGRGGGSAEDLWAFNEEIVARAIYRSRIPVISAVGHEPDVTISDYVADLRAATPSNAAEIAVPDQKELRKELDSIKTLLTQSLSERLKLSQQQLKHRTSALLFHSPVRILESQRQQLDHLMERLVRVMFQRIQTENLLVERKKMDITKIYMQQIENQRKKLLQFTAQLEAMSPLKVLSRGYSITEDCFGNIVKSAEDIQPGDFISVRLWKGSIKATVNECLEEKSCPKNQ